MSTPASLPTSCSAPGAIWLVLFFVVPLYYLGELSLNSGVFGSYEFNWHWENYSDALQPLRHASSCARFLYAGLATLLALLLAYPLAYTIAFKAGRWRNLLLFAVVAPFFTTYLIRTLAWETILSDQSPVVERARLPRPGARTGTSWPPRGAVIAGLTYNFLPFMVLPIYASLERLDVRLIEAAQGPLRLGRADLLAGDAAALGAGGGGGHAAHLHPRLRRLRQRPVPRQRQQPDDRQRDPVALPETVRLPGGGGALLRADGDDPDRRPGLHPLRRLRGADGRGGGG